MSEMIKIAAVAALTGVVGFLGYTTFPEERTVVDSRIEAADPTTGSGFADVLDPSVRISDFCSGTVIESGTRGTFVLTAKHCVYYRPGIHNIEIDVTIGTKTVDTNIYPAEVWSFSPTADLAILRIMADEVRLPVAKVLPEHFELNIGDYVRFVSHPQGWTELITDGWLGPTRCIKNFTKWTPSCEFQVASVDNSGGSSGGGLYTFKGRDYYLIGTLTGSFTGSEFMAYFTTIDDIRQYVYGKAFEKGYGFPEEKGKTSRIGSTDSSVLWEPKGPETRPAPNYPNGPDLGLPKDADGEYVDGFQGVDDDE